MTDESEGLEETSAWVLADRIALELSLVADRHPAMLAATIAKVSPAFAAIEAEGKKSASAAVEARDTVRQIAAEVRELTKAAHDDLDELEKRISGLHARLDQAAKKHKQLESGIQTKGATK